MEEDGLTISNFWRRMFQSTAPERQVSDRVTPLRSLGESESDRTSLRTGLRDAAEDAVETTRLFTAPGDNAPTLLFALVHISPFDVDTDFVASWHTFAASWLSSPILSLSRVFLRTFIASTSMLLLCKANTAQWHNRTVSGQREATNNTRDIRVERWGARLG
jgi:hypothetical protein